MFALVDVPLHEILYDALVLDDLERRDRLAREADGIRAAYLVNYAVCDPKRLEREAQQYHARLWAQPTASKRGPLTDDERARVAAIIAAIRARNAPPTPAPAPDSA